mmetsp:Transcript_14343/g.38395  ORF Transcript_14343/g.38395 Transcript_14343/m.38395 type:complete len:232 (+) Transcript_14343:1102-1797(+)
MGHFGHDVPDHLHGELFCLRAEVLLGEQGSRLLAEGSVGEFSASRLCARREHDLLHVLLVEVKEGLGELVPEQVRARQSAHDIVRKVGVHDVRRDGIDDFSQPSEVLERGHDDKGIRRDLLHVERGQILAELRILCRRIVHPDDIGGGLDVANLLRGKKRAREPLLKRNDVVRGRERRSLRYSRSQERQHLVDEPPVGAEIRGAAREPQRRLLEIQHVLGRIHGVKLHFPG